MSACKIFLGGQFMKIYFHGVINKNKVGFETYLLPKNFFGYSIDPAFLKIFEFWLIFLAELSCLSISFD